MTDRINCLIVTFKEPKRTDDADAYVDAIRLLKDVLKVEKGPIDDLQRHTAKTQIQYDIYQKLMESVMGDK